jgi:hypothetical protein
MIDKLTKYVGSRPRRAAVIMLALSVVLILILAGILIQSLNVGRLFKPPYPSESTPLSLAGNDLKWSPLMNYQFGEVTNYTLYRFYYSGWGGFLSNQSEQNRLSSHSQTTIVSFVGSQGYWLNLSITDSTGDGFFGIGDNVIFEGMPHLNDTVYVVAMHYNGEHQMGGWEYSYAIHHGKFYSWASSTLNQNIPWWAT